MTGMLELSKAGLSVSETYDAISGTLSLAAAAGIEVGRASEIASNAMNVFGLKGSEVGRVADVLAATANASSLEITDLADSLNMAGAVAASAGMDIGAVSTAFGILGNQGMKGSDAGTSLKQMLLSLEAPSNKAAGLMREMGFAAYNADGSMKSLRDIIGNLGTATADMTQQERDFTLATLFGSDAVRAANILLTQGVEGYDKMSASVNATGAAQKAADANLKGLSGAMEYFSGTLDTVLITQGTPWLDMLSGMTRGAADLLASFGDLPEPVQKTGVALGAVAAVSGPMLIAVGSMSQGVAALSAVFTSHTAAIIAHRAVTVASTIATAGLTAAQWALNVALSANPIGLIVIGLAALTAGVIWAYQNVDWFREGVDKAWAFITNAFEHAQDWVPLLLGPLGLIMMAWSNNWGDIQGKVEAVLSFVGNLFEGFKSTAVAIWDGIGSGIKAAVDWLGSALGDAWDGITSGATAAWEGIKSLIGSAWDGIVAFIRGGVNEGISLINGFTSAISAIQIHIPEVDIPLVGVVGGWTVSMPQIPPIPYLGAGGNIMGGGMALVGERGPEIVDLPQGARVTPLAAGRGGGGGGTYITNVNVRAEGHIWAEDDLVDLIRRRFIEIQRRNVNLFDTNFVGTQVNG